MDLDEVAHYEPPHQDRSCLVLSLSLFIPRVIYCFLHFIHGYFSLCFQLKLHMNRSGPGRPTQDTKPWNLKKSFIITDISHDDGG